MKEENQLASKPITAIYAKYGAIQAHISKGITMREYIATNTLNGILCASTSEHGFYNPDAKETAKLATSYTDALLAELQATQPTTIQSDSGTLIYKSIPDDLQKEVPALKGLSEMYIGLNNAKTLIEACEEHYKAKVVQVQLGEKSGGVQPPIEAGSWWFIILRKD